MRFIVGLFHQGECSRAVHTVRRRNAANCWALARKEKEEQDAAGIWRVVFVCQDVDQPASEWQFRETILSATRIGCQATFVSCLPSPYAIIPSNPPFGGSGHALN